jgi:signal transduction histidine kinase
MGAMISDLVDAARLEGGQLHLAPMPLDLGRLSADVVARMGEADSQRVVVAASADLPRVAADPMRIERALANLIGNALKYSAAPAPVRVGVGAFGDEVRVEVQDAGSGVAPEELPRLFRRHGRTGSSRGRADSLGLGLYIVRGIVEAHGGRVWVESTVGIGSTFGFALPVARASEKRALGRAAPPSDGQLLPDQITAG